MVENAQGWLIKLFFLSKWIETLTQETDSDQVDPLSTITLPLAVVSRPQQQTTLAAEPRYLH